MIWRSGYPDVAVGGTTLPALVESVIERQPDRTALIDGPSGASVSYAEFGRRVERISAWLAGRGVAAGSTLALWAPNSPPWAAFALAAMRLGAAVTGVNPMWTPAEAQRQFRDAGVAVVVTTPALAGSAAELVGASNVVTLGDAEAGTALRDVLANDDPTPPAATDESAVALVPYSSGTTGLPKGVPLTHANLVTAVRQVEAVARFADRDTMLALAPFFHVLGGVVMMAVPLAVGATVVTVPRFDPALVVDLIERHRVTASAVPPPVAAFLAHCEPTSERGTSEAEAKPPRFSERALSSLELLAVGGAPLTVPVHRALAARLPRCVVAQGWGLTETTASVCVPDRSDPSPPGTVGRLVPNTELMVVDPATGDAVGPGQPGELWVRGPQVMAGYLNEPAATAEILDAAGWLRTGDLGRVEPGGHVVIVDRLKELIKVDGYQVAPAELEALLLTHPLIADAAVVGRGDERHGEVAVAYVVASGPLDGREVRDWAAPRVAPYKRLADVTVVDSLPRTPAGKLLRRVLRDRTG
jgi:acyl-CoA synthetase (AMP-forming)/AMP-acid ligase II